LMYLMSVSTVVKSTIKQCLGSRIFSYKPWISWSGRLFQGVTFATVQIQIFSRYHWSDDKMGIGCRTFIHRCGYWKRESQEFFEQL